jgi:hypothetical protein
LLPGACAPGCILPPASQAETCAQFNVLNQTFCANLRKGALPQKSLLPQRSTKAQIGFAAFFDLFVPLCGKNWSKKFER